jgi:hypothetical protein
MKFRIVRNIDFDLIKEIVPTKYKSLAVSCESQFSNICTLIIFPHDNRDVVKSSLVEKALKCIEKLTEPQLVVVGGCFSIEATNILKSQNTIFISLSEQYRIDS